MDLVFQKIHKPMHAPLFSFSDGTCFTYKMLQERLRGVLAEVGHPTPLLFSSHSYHRGGTTFSFLCGVPIELIKVLGNWRSNAFLRYLEFPLEM